MIFVLRNRFFSEICMERTSNGAKLCIMLEFCNYFCNYFVRVPYFLVFCTLIILRVVFL